MLVRRTNVFQNQHKFNEPMHIYSVHWAYICIYGNELCRMSTIKQWSYRVPRRSVKDPLLLPAKVSEIGCSSNSFQIEADGENKKKNLYNFNHCRLVGKSVCGMDLGVGYSNPSEKGSPCSQQDLPRPPPVPEQLWDGWTSMDGFLGLPLRTPLEGGQPATGTTLSFHLLQPWGPHLHRYFCCH